MKESTQVFLTAEWRHLAMLNYDMDPSILDPLVPAGTELDRFEGRTIVSLVGFLFLKTRILGIPIPFHRNFEEVNLRFYVHRRTADGWRRAVVFVKEFVPRFAIAGLARTLYGKNYIAVPMGHSLGPRSVSYRWRFMGADNSMQMTFHGEAAEVQAGGEEEFITEHYWGYTRRPNGITMEYQVAHPRWRVWKADQAQFDGDAGALYGKGFATALQARPASAFLADGSAVSVFKGKAVG